ncbi:hypothetical protein B0H34DRAFT_863460 [Crassisporium funariophilum]|nr:hypothetical protein B0H34DRAFT_863460 [Crassisporium funariophilum]
MKFALIANFVFFALAANATPAAISARKNTVAGSAQLTCPIVSSDGAVNVRTCASTSCGVATTVNPGDNVIFTCWTTGTVISGNPFWDKTGNGHYISEHYIGGSCPTSLPEC